MWIRGRGGRVGVVGVDVVVRVVGVVEAARVVVKVGGVLRGKIGGVGLCGGGEVFWIDLTDWTDSRMLVTLPSGGAGSLAASAACPLLI